MKRCRISLFFCIAFIFCMQGVAQQATNTSLPTDGRVDGTTYRNSYFGFNYFIPEEWAARGTPGKMPGATSGYLLLTLKQKSGDAFSSLKVSATDISKTYKGNLLEFMDDRYRLHQEASLPETTINGIRAGRSKAVDREPESVIIGDRQFYRVTTESTGTTMVAMATVEKGYALIFELIVPTQRAPEATTVFMDSMIALNFNAPVSVVKK
jgi:hypothetical protein